MSFYRDPEIYQKALAEVGLIDDIYSAMKREDPADLVQAALLVLMKTQTIPELERQKKSESVSNAFRNEGNQQYKAGNYLKALICYNKALLYAPAKSQAMKLAYSNRSALLFRFQTYKACVQDIDTCLDMGLTGDIIDKLQKRKDESIKLMWNEKMSFTSFSADFFRFDVQRNLQIPCASTDIEVIKEAESLKVVAAKDIKVGTVVAVETPFVSLLNSANRNISCYYCHKMSLNLIPCPNCCSALFCNEQCKKLCMKESHSFECHIIELYYQGYMGPMASLVLKAILKMKHMCKSWKELIEASHKLGSERFKNSSVNEICDSNNKFCLLNFTDSKHMKYGAMYNFGFVSATLIHNLSMIPSFLPQSFVEKKEVISALARLMMTLFLALRSKVDVNNVIDDRITGEIRHFFPNHACLAFTGKLRHECEANLLPIGLNNKVALVALHPIKKGTELTISYVQHAYNHICESESLPLKHRALHLYRFSRVCHCCICKGTWNTCVPKLTSEQRKCFKKWMVLSMNNKGDVMFKATCDALSVLHTAPYTKEYQVVYVQFRRLLSLFQYAITQNIGPTE